MPAIVERRNEFLRHDNCNERSITDAAGRTQESQGVSTLRARELPDAPAFWDPEVPVEGSERAFESSEDSAQDPSPRAGPETPSPS